MYLPRSVFKHSQFSIYAWPGISFAIDIKTGNVFDECPVKKGAHRNANRARE
jgi:hypothetical protein